MPVFPFNFTGSFGPFWWLDFLKETTKLAKYEQLVMVLGSTQPLTEMSTRNLPRGKGWPARKAEKLPAICERIA
jgi:hypothetical protein